MKSFIGLLPLALLFSGAATRPAPPVAEYLSMPGPIRVGTTDFKLAWSAHPTPNYYKQEYVPAKETVEQYSQMVLVEVVLGDLTVRDAVQAQISTIEARKATDALAGYQLMENPDSGEMMLESVLSAGPAASPSVVEWNVNRYRRFQDKSGRQGVLLFAISKRGYGAQTPTFLASMNAQRAAAVQTLAAYKIPAVAVK